MLKAVIAAEDFKAPQATGAPLMVVPGHKRKEGPVVSTVAVRMEAIPAGNSLEVMPVASIMDIMVQAEVVIMEEVVERTLAMVPVAVVQVLFLQEETP